MRIAPSNKLAQRVADGAVRARGLDETRADALNAPVVEGLVAQAEEAGGFLAMEGAVIRIIWQCGTD